MDHGVATDPNVDVDVGRLRILQGHAVRQVTRVDPLADDPSGPGEVGARVDPHRPAGVHGDDRDPLPLVDQDREDVVQVVLGLRVLAPDERERPEQVVAAERDPVGPDLADRAHRGRRVGPLDDRDEAVALTDDPRVGPRPLDLGRDHRGGRSRSPVDADEPADVLRSDRIEVAVGDEHLARSTDRLLGRQHRVPGSERIPLLDEHRLGGDPPRPDRVADLLRAVVHDDRDLRRARRADVLQDPPEGGAAADRMEHLRRGGLQPLALACGEHHGDERRRLGHGFLSVGGHPLYRRAAPAGKVAGPVAASGAVWQRGTTWFRGEESNLHRRLQRPASCR